jgi:hypothetical protein
MNKIFITILVVLLASCKNEAPFLKIDSSRLQHLPDTASKASMTLYNTGGEKLVIEDFVVSCGCTVPSLEKGISINTGDSLFVPMTFERDSSKKKKVVVITLKSNSQPRINTIKFYL